MILNDIIDQKQEIKTEIFKWYEDLEPLVYSLLPPIELTEYRKRICLERNLSLRTLRRHVKKAKEEGSCGLFRQPRSDKGQYRKFNPRLTSLACQFLGEYSLASVKDVLKMLQNNDDIDIKKCALDISCSTLYIIKSGFDFSKRHSPQERRYHKFEAPYAHSLWQGDARDGIWLPVEGRSGKMQKTYLFAWIDDYSRKIVYAKYYFDEQLPRLEDSFRQAVLRWGLPEKIYCDNGSVYVSKHFAFIVESVGIRKIHHKPFHSWAKGKIERWNRTVKKFQEHAQKAGMKTLEELNSAFDAWLEVEYHTVEHGETGEAPNKRFNDSVSKTPPRRIDNCELFDDLFLWQEKRNIDKHGRVHLFTNEYRIASGAPRTQIEIHYSPFDLSKVKIYKDKIYIETAVACVIKQERLKNIPEEKDKPKNEIIEESQKYFLRLRGEREQLRHKELDEQIKFSKLKKDI